MIKLFTLLAVSILQGHIDSNLTNWNANETVLTPVNVSQLKITAQFHTDGPIFGQPLIFPFTINAINYNVLISCTLNDTCYAFDADSVGKQIWKTSLGITSRIISGSQNIGQFLTEARVGCVATPAVDITNGWVFALCATNSPSWALYKLNLSTGAVISNVVIAATSGTTTFSAAQENGRGALVIANNNIYLTFASYNDITPYNGWIIGYAESNLAQIGSWCATPTGTQGGIWSSGGGPAVDSNGNLYVVTGNGTFDGTTNFSNSVVKLTSTLAVSDFFTPSNSTTINAVDADLAANRAILIPSTTLIVHVGKAFQIFLLNTANMGHLQGGGGAAPNQTWTIAGTPGNASGAYGSLWMNNIFYIPNTSGGLSTFSFNGSTFNTTPSATISMSVGFPGAGNLTGSSNGVSSGIVWITTTRENHPADTLVQDGVLHALDASTLSELWNSGSTLGGFTKFCTATVANGKVYVPTISSVIVTYGLTSSSRVI